MSRRSAAERVPRPAPTSRRSRNSSATCAAKSGGSQPPAFSKAAQQLTGELGVVGVLAEGKVRVGPLSGPPGSQPAFDVHLGHLRWLGLDHEPERVAQCLSQNRAGETDPRSRRVAGATSRPQCLQTRARARMRSAQ